MKWPCPDSPRAVPSQVSALESNQRFPIHFIRRFPSAPSSLDSNATADIRRRSRSPVWILQSHLRLANRVIDAPTQKRRSRYFALRMPLNDINGRPLRYRQPCIFPSVESGGKGRMELCCLYNKSITECGLRRRERWRNAVDVKAQIALEARTSIRKACNEQNQFIRCGSKSPQRTASRV
jgi:hypothetical protein